MLLLVVLQYKDGKHVRDLSKLNRDLTQVLFISGEH
jgi:TFIIF-interacting CTD phosphatase-like protein